MHLSATIHESFSVETVILSRRAARVKGGVVATPHRPAGTAEYQLIFACSSVSAR